MIIEALVKIGAYVSIALVLLIWFYLLARLVSWGAAKSWKEIMNKNKKEEEKDE